MTARTAKTVKAIEKSRIEKDKQQNKHKDYEQDMIQTQKERKAPPSDEDYEELRELLWDFHITADIPVFSNRMEMDRWRHKILMEW